MCALAASAVQTELDSLSGKYNNAVGTLLNVTERPDHLGDLVEVSVTSGVGLDDKVGVCAN